MKNLMIGLFALGLTSLGFSQDINNEMDEVHIKGVVIPNVNLNYLNKVQDITLPVSVLSLEKEASLFKVKGVDDFDGRDDVYQVKFVGTKGYILADYDRDGKILKTSERYKDIALPKQLIKEVLNQYPESSFLKIAYSVDYEDQKTSDKIYKIQIMKDSKKKNLKIRPTGKLDNALTAYLIN